MAYKPFSCSIDFPFKLLDLEAATSRSEHLSINMYETSSYMYKPMKGIIMGCVVSFTLDVFVNDLVKFMQDI